MVRINSCCVVCVFLHFCQIASEICFFFSLFSFQHNLPQITHSFLWCYCQLQQCEGAKLMYIERNLDLKINESPTFTSFEWCFCETQNVPDSTKSAVKILNVLNGFHALSNFIKRYISRAFAHSLLHTAMHDNATVFRRWVNDHFKNPCFNIFVADSFCKYVMYFVGSSRHLLNGVPLEPTSNTNSTEIRLYTRKCTTHAILLSRKNDNTIFHGHVSYQLYWMNTDGCAVIGKSHGAVCVFSHCVRRFDGPRWKFYVLLISLLQSYRIIIIIKK